MISQASKTGAPAKNISDILLNLGQEKKLAAEGEEDALFQLFAGVGVEEKESFQNILGSMGKNAVDTAVLHPGLMKKPKPGLEELKAENALMAQQQMQLAGQLDPQKLALEENTQAIAHVAGKKAQAKEKASFDPSAVLEKVAARASDKGNVERSFFMPKDRLIERHKETFDDWPRTQNAEGGELHLPVLGEMPMPNSKVGKLQEANKLRGLSTYKNALGEKAGMPMMEEDMGAMLSPNQTAGAEVLNFPRSLKAESVKNYEAMIEKPGVSLRSAGKAEFLPQIDGSQLNIRPMSIMPADINFAQEVGLEQMVQGSEHEILNKIAQNIESSTSAHHKDLKFTVHSQDLGKIEIQVMKKNQMDDLDIKISTHSKEAQEFFKDHRHELVNKLNNSGISVADLRIETGPGPRFEEKFAVKDMQKSTTQSEYNKNDEQNAREDSERRKEIWDKLNTRA